MKQPEGLLKLRFAEVEHLLHALSLVPTEQTTSVTHQALLKTLRGIKEGWVREDKARKAQLQRQALTQRPRAKHK
jgi:hypothetical protein